MNRRSALLFSIIAMLVMALALALDATVAQRMRVFGFAEVVQSHLWLREVLIAPGFYGFTLMVAVIVGFRHVDESRAALFVLLTTACAGLSTPIKWVVGRTRPYKLNGNAAQLAPFEFHPFQIAKNLCFPSGHSMLAFATAAALSMLWPRLRWLWYLVAAFVAVERVAENAHWLSDTVAGAAMGIGGAYLIAWLLKSWKINLLTSRS